MPLQAGHPDWWFFKVKRYPWNVSYGNKHADKAIEATKTLLEKQNVSLPPPSNMDAESAKSLLIFLLKVSLLDVHYHSCLTREIRFCMPGIFFCEH